MPIPCGRSVTPVSVIGHDSRWRLVRQLLHDDALPAVTRVTGLLLLLYGQPVSRIARLRLDQITQAGGHVTLTLGPVPIILPNPLDELVLGLAAHRHGYGVLGRTGDHPWLFPGSTAGQPITGETLVRRLNRLGIRARPARNTTLMEFAAELPAAVISRLLGLSTTAAQHWITEAAASRTYYAADLTHR